MAKPARGARGWASALGRHAQRFVATMAWVGPMQVITSTRGGTMVRGLLGLLIVIAIVLFLVKVAVAGGIVGAIALILLILIVLGRV
jgi:membrane protein required for beta-lactamase induction